MELSSIDVSNGLSPEKQNQVIALGRLGWPLRRIEKAAGVRRETAAGYLRSAGVAVRQLERWGRPSPEANPAIEVTTDSAGGATPNPANEAPQVATDSEPPQPSRSPSASACLPYSSHLSPHRRILTVCRSRMAIRVRLEPKPPSLPLLRNLPKISGLDRGDRQREYLGSVLKSWTPGFLTDSTMVDRQERSTAGLRGAIKPFRILL